MIQIAFAGHNRPRDLGPREQVSAALRAAFELIRDADVGEARLLTGLAPGADELAAAAWREAGLGPIHAAFSFLDDPASDEVGPGRLAESGTWLDGVAAEAQGRNPYLKQTRLIVEAADLVVVVWTGGPARGAGGTADAVLCALQLGLPVLWIKPAEPHPLRLIRPEQLPSDFHFPEFQEALHSGRLDHVEIAHPDSFRDAIGYTGPAASPDGEPLPSWRAVARRVLNRTLWRTYAVFRNLMGGKVEMASTDVPVPESLAEQPGFKHMTAAYFEADHSANRLSAIHRSEIVLLVVGMIAAAAVGSAWTMWPKVKVLAMCIELALSITALVVWITASYARQHERWSEQRHRAEHLRLDRAGWVIGVGIAGAMPAQGQPGGRVARDALRESGLPHGKYDPERVRTWGAWAMNELIRGQAAYHRASSVRDGRIAHRIHMLEDASFVLFLLVFALYVLAYAVGWGHYLPAWTVGVVAMTGTVVPAVAAASIALEAKLEFQEQSARSRRIATSLDELSTRLGPDPSFDTLQDVGRAALRLHLAESTQWREGTDRRRLFRL